MINPEYKGDRYTCYTEPGKRDSTSDFERLRFLDTVSDLKLKKINSEDQKFDELYTFENSEEINSDMYSSYENDHKEAIRYSKNVVPNLLSKEEVMKSVLVVFIKDSAGRYYRCESNKLYIDTSGWVEPLIYIYSKHRQLYELKLSNSIKIVDAIPNTFNNSWQFYADSKGRLYFPGTNQREKYIYWEGIGPSLPELPRQGDVVSAQNLDSYFSQRLQQFGFNAQEIYDFKKFWLKELSPYPNVLIEFLVNSEVDHYAPLEIKPRMNQIIRIYLIYRPLVDQKDVFPEKKYPVIIRKEDKVLVEWGGLGRLRFH